MKQRKILSRETVESLDSLLEQQHESSERVKDDVRRNNQAISPDGDFDVTSEEQQRGRVYERSMFVRKVRKLNPNLWYEQSINYPKQGGFYMADSFFGKRFICGFPHDSLTEFAVRMTVPEIIPHPSLADQWEHLKRVDNQIPGWRSVLATLIKNGLITEAQAEKEFRISHGRSSQKWQETIH